MSTTIERFSISLTPELAGSVTHAVDTGQYASVSEVIREALRDWNIRQMQQQQQLDEIRRLVQEGIASGPSRFKTAGAALDDIERRLQLKQSEV